MDWVLQGSMIRIRECALDVLSVDDYISDDDSSWDFVASDLRLRSTFLYLDFSQMISRTPEDQKKPLVDLGNDVHWLIEELITVVKSRNVSQFYELFDEVSEILQEVVDLMPPSNTESDSDSDSDSELL